MPRGVERQRPLPGRRACTASSFSAALALALALLSGMLTAGSALAISQRGHAFSFAFGETGVGPNQFSSPQGLAVNNSNGDVFVADSRNNRVQEFKPTLNEHGEVVGESLVRSLPVEYPIAVAVDNSTSDPTLQR